MQINLIARPKQPIQMERSIPTSQYTLFHISRHKFTVTNVKPFTNTDKRIVNIEVAGLVQNL